MNYLYNGVEMPEIPTVPYKYAIITDHVISYFTDSKPYAYVLDDGVTVVVRADGETKGHILYKDGWGNGIVSNNLFIYGTNFIWTNTDILYADGTVAFSASDPIPVNPAPTLDPTALLMGWQGGNRIRQRV